MPLHQPLPKRAVTLIEAAVEALFARAKIRLLGRDHAPRRLLFGPTTVLEHRHDLSLPGLFDAASHSEGFSPRDDVRAASVRAAETYLDAYRERAKAAAVEAVEAARAEAYRGGKDAAEAAKKALRSRLADVMVTATNDVKRMVETEVTGVRNAGSIDGIVKVNTLAGVGDPVVYFVSVNDSHRCSECTKLHTLDDGLTPRVWKMSEVEAGYHRRGSGRPSMKGLHPHCRCSLCTLMPGFGFDHAGRATFVENGHDELAAQRSEVAD